MALFQPSGSSILPAVAANATVEPGPGAATGSIEDLSSLVAPKQQVKLEVALQGLGTLGVTALGGDIDDLQAAAANAAQARHELGSKLARTSVQIRKNNESEAEGLRARHFEELQVFGFNAEQSSRYLHAAESEALSPGSVHPDLSDPRYSIILDESGYYEGPPGITGEVSEYGSGSLLELARLNKVDLPRARLAEARLGREILRLLEGNEAVFSNPHEGGSANVAAHAVAVAMVKAGSEVLALDKTIEICTSAAPR